MVSPTTDRRFGISGNVAVKAPVALAITSNITLSGEQTIQGITTNASRVLVAGQTDASENGLYDTSTGAWTRALDANGVYDVKCGTIVLVTGGDYASALFRLTTPDVVTIGSSDLEWESFFVSEDSLSQVLGQTTFTYYVATTGSDSNSGTVSSPFATVQKAFDVLTEFGTIGGTRVINVAAGTYTAPAIFSLKSVNRVQVRGVAGWVGTPTVIFDGGGTEETMFGAREGAKLYLKDVWVKNTTDNVVDAQDGSELYIQDCHITDAVGASSGACVYIANNSRGYINGRCLIENAASSEGLVLAYGGSIISVGQDGTNSSDSPNFGGTSQRGIKAEHQSLIKLRRAYIDGSGMTYGVYADTASHISHEAGSNTSSTYAYFTNGGATILMAPGGSVDLTGVTVLRRSVANPGIWDRPIQTDDLAWRRVGLFVAADLTNASVTGTTTQTDILSACMALLAQDFNDAGRAFKIRAHGTITNGGSASTKTFGISGSVNGSIRTISAGATDNGNFVVEFTTTALTRALTTVSILREASIVMDEIAPQFVSDVSTKQLNSAQNIGLNVTLGNAGDTVAVHAIEVFQAGI